MARKNKVRTRLPTEQRLADILKEAREVFIETGYDDASMVEIADRVGIVAGTLYRYFESKHDLLVKVIEVWLQEESADYDRQLAGVKGVKNRLRFMVWHHLNMLYKNPKLGRLFVQYIRASDDYEQTACYELNRAYTQHTIDIVKEGIKSGEFRKDTPVRTVRDMVYGTSEYRIWRYSTGRTDEFDVEEATDTIADLVYNSIANPRSVTQRSTKVELDRLSNLVDKLEGVSDRLTDVVS